ncbi:Methylenetetrahydrofolate reductase [Fragilaria crotonensis]|nr:Methylenetetrahydrofolate reductase [Fragilaria crotonensis]
MTLTEAARSSTCEGQTFTCRDEDYKKEMDYLKQKVDAGADFIITQMFFDTAVFIQFVKDCRMGHHLPRRSRSHVSECLRRVQENDQILQIPRPPNWKPVVYGILDSIGLSENATSKAIEADANSMQASDRHGPESVIPSRASLTRSRDRNSCGPRRCRCHSH